MIMRSLLTVLLCTVSLSSLPAQELRQSIEIDLQDQMAYLIEDGQLVLSTPISTGRSGHFTETGVFKVVEKERNHYSNMYGKIVDARGETVVADADADMPVPRGGKFVPAPMRYFMRFNDAIGMHAGYLPGYPASHGCVRLPEANAIALFNSVEIGTRVTVFGTTSRASRRPTDGYSMERQPRRVDPRTGQRSFTSPTWWR